MYKKIISLGMLLVMVFSLGGCIEPTPPKAADWEALYATAQGWGYSGNLDEFVAMLLGESGKKDDPKNAGLSAYEIFKKHNAWYLNDEAQWKFDVLEGNLEYIAELNQPMPQIWEEEIGGKELDYSAIGFDLPAVFISDVTEITIGKDITVIDWHILDGCKNLENIYVEEGNLAFVSDGGVLYSKSYQTLCKWPPKKPVTTIRDTVKYFEVACFSYCETLESFELPDDTVSIGEWAFFGTNLTKLHIKENVKTVGNKKPRAINIFPSTIQEIEISAPIVYHSFFSAFSGKPSDVVTTIIFHEGVKQIRPLGNRVRENCYNLLYVENITFPETLEMIGDVSFPVNSSVAHYTIPENVKFMDKWAFDDRYPGVVEYTPGLLVDPLIYKRKCVTEFECKSEYTEQYIQKMLPVWEKSIALVK